MKLPAWLTRAPVTQEVARINRFRADFAKLDDARLRARFQESGDLLEVIAVVAANVHVWIGKETGHFAEESVDEDISGFASRIEGGIHDAELVGDCVGTGRAAEVWIADQPTLDVTGHVELGDDADAAG